MQEKTNEGEGKVVDKTIKKIGGNYRGNGLGKCSRWRKNRALNEGARTRKSIAEGQVGSDITLKLRLVKPPITYFFRGATPLPELQTAEAILFGGGGVREK